MRLIRLAMLMMLILVGMTTMNNAQESVQAKTYICPPCGCQGDSLTFYEPGKCQHCGMRLIDKQDLRNVAIFVFDGVELLDFTGPMETFAAAMGRFNMFTVGTASEHKTGMGSLTFKTDYTLDNCPQVDILVIPGGGTGHISSDKEILGKLKRLTDDAEIVLSVCSGAFVLGEMGLLDGLKATAHSSANRRLAELYPKVEIVNNVRFVDNGKIITSAGVSAGIDGALHVIERLFGEEEMRHIADYMEYVIH